MSEELEIMIKGQPSDFRLCELLGDKPADFLALCLDGVQLEDFGTPYDTPRNRVDRQGLIMVLNDRTPESLWPQFWRNWKLNICKQFNLPETTTSDVFRPVVSMKIVRVCPGYSEHLHAAIGLFERLDSKIRSWSCNKLEAGQFWCAITSRDGKTIGHRHELLQMAIVHSVMELIKGEQAKGGAK